MTPALVLMTVLHVIDGDSFKVQTPWVDTPIAVMDLRITGIDTPEKRRPLAKCVPEIRKAAAATDFAKAIVHPGDQIQVRLTGKDKYFRLLGKVTLPDGRDYGQTIIAQGHARPYKGGKKSSWCP